MAHTLSEVCVQAGQCVAGINFVFSNQSGISGLGLHCFRKMLHLCFSVKLQKCFVDTLSKFPSA